MTRIDLRSDTVTRPTPEMRQAMAAADVGDDVYGEDPSVNELEALACRLTGKEAALFVASGTMGNVAALLSHTQRGDEVLCGYRSHIYRREQAAMATLGSLQARPILEDSGGMLPLPDIEAAIQTDDIHHPVTRLICLENTHNSCGGQPLTPEYTAAVADLAREYGLKLHLDGARLFNAAVALGVSAETLVAPADSVTFCVSKALCAPAGSLLCGSEAFVARARRARKMLGGGMRQIGVLAAAGTVALTTMMKQLPVDHANAHRLARRLSALDGLRVDPDHVQTNIVYFHLDESVRWTAGDIVGLMQERGILFDHAAARTIRAVTHYWVTEEMVDRTADALSALLAT